MIELPEIPKVKSYIDDMTQEQKVLAKCVKNSELTEGEESTLIECIEFYKLVFPILKSIDLSLVSTISKYYFFTTLIYHSLQHIFSA